MSNFGFKRIKTNLVAQLENTLNDQINYVPENYFFITIQEKDDHLANNQEQIYAQDEEEEVDLESLNIQGDINTD